MNSSFFKYVEEIFNSGDPEVRTWFLIRNNYMPIILCSLYVGFVKVIGPAIMKNKTPFDFRMFMVAYNFSVVAAYALSLGKIIFLIFERKVLSCGEMVVTRQDGTFELVSSLWTVYMLKYVEFLDTCFFVLRKKNHLITNLHVIHHAVLPVILWTGFRTETSGFQAYILMINSTVHIVMYTYYGLAAMGPKVQKYLWWKRYLTIFQMAQFVIILGFAVVVPPLAGCTSKRTAIIMDIFFATFFFIFFCNFYRHTFQIKTPVKRRVH